MHISDKIKNIVAEIIPSEGAQIEATRRYDICEKCNKFEVKNNIEICIECGCRIRSKLFSPELQCPLNKH